ncbi:MAG TPA: SH3 domain-containing protein [Dehalococcoidia bacterium]|nr:SH3 domain-containing protein [Dehalococcoidia bacterium]
MDKAPRFNFFSLTFFIGFGLGGFMGVLLGLLALALVLDEDEVPSVAALVQPTSTFEPGLTPTPESKPRTKTALDVRLGPGTAFAVVGTIARGGEVEPVGRDNGSAWIAIRFPPGSAARGWVPVSEIEHLSGVDRLAVVLPTPLPRSASVPDLNRGELGARIVDGDDPPALGSGTLQRTATAGTPTPTPRPTGPTDLVASRASLLPDGRIQVLVGNRGPGELTGRSVFVLVRDLTLRSEQLSIQPGVVPVGAQVTLQSQNFRVERPTEIQVIVDPFSNLNDPDRSNNQLSITLSPAPVPTPTRNPFD